MRERKKTGVHGTLKVIPVAWKFNSKQLLCKTLNSRNNIIETRAVLNIVKKREKMSFGVRKVGPRINPKASVSVTNFVKKT